MLGDGFDRVGLSISHSLSAVREARESMRNEESNDKPSPEREGRGDTGRAVGKKGGREGIDKRRRAERKKGKQTKGRRNISVLSQDCSVLLMVIEGPWKI